MMPRSGIRHVAVVLRSGSDGRWPGSKATGGKCYANVICLFNTAGHMSTYTNTAQNALNAFDAYAFRPKRFEMGSIFSISIMNKKVHHNLTMSATAGSLTCPRCGLTQVLGGIDI